jgi:amino acid transporter
MQNVQSKKRNYWLDFILGLVGGAIGTGVLALATNHTTLHRYLPACAIMPAMFAGLCLITSALVDQVADAWQFVVCCMGAALGAAAIILIL